MHIYNLYIYLYYMDCVDILLLYLFSMSTQSGPNVHTIRFFFLKFHVWINFNMSLEGCLLEKHFKWIKIFHFWKVEGNTLTIL